MKFIKKLIKRILVLVFILCVLAIFINAKTRFFRNIGTYLPTIDSEQAEFISKLSDSVNEFVYQLPTPSEFWAKIHHTELPIDPDDIAANTYYSSDTMLNFYNADNISVSVNGYEADVYGITNNPNSKHIVYRFLDENADIIDQFTDICDSEGKFRKIMTIPDGAYQLAVFAGPEQFGSYLSVLYNYVLLEQDQNGAWRVAMSPVYSHNITEYEKAKSASLALRSTYDICSDDPNVIALAQSITSGIASDYEKALALHDWVCTNIYYDSDSVSQTGLNTASYVATDVIRDRRAVCLGYSNLYASLCRAVSIPCNIVTGYAIGAEGYDIAWTDANIQMSEANHAWNEVYIDDRRIIVDTTWDSRNKIKDGTAESGDVLHLFFDANLRFFSQNHKIIEYLR